MSSIKHSVWIPVAAVLVLGAALALPRLGTSALWDIWEPRYAQAAREMSERGDWIVPYYREAPRLNRPPMTYWLIGASHAVLGVNEAAARLPSALLAILCPALLAWAFASIGRRLEGFLAGAALLTSPQWLLLGRVAMPSLALAAWLGIALALAIAAPSIAGRKRRQALQVIAVLLVAAAALTDWPRGVLLAVWGVLGWGATRLGWRGVAGLIGVAAVYHAGQLSYSVTLNLAAIALGLGLCALILRRAAGVPWRHQAWGALLLAVVLAPWFLALVAATSGELKLFNYKYALNLGEGVGDHTGPYHYVLVIVTVGALPWVGAALAGLGRGFGRAADPLARALAGVWGGMMLFFILAEARMGHFYVVVQPALAGLAAIGTLAAVRRRGWGLLAIGLLLIVGWLLVWDEPARLLETATVKRSLFGFDPVPVTTLAVAGWAVGLSIAVLRRRPAWALACVLPGALLAGSLALHAVPALGPKKSVKAHWIRYLADRRPGEPLAAYGSSRDSSFYYSAGAIVRLDDSAELRGFLEGPGAKFLIVSRRSYRRLERRRFGGRWSVLDRSHPSHLLVRVVPDVRSAAQPH